MKTIILFLSLALPVAAQTTVAVGNCKPHLTSYTTVSAAIAAVAPNSTVLICPGTYPEQVTITLPLTLRGLDLGIPGNYPVIAVPSGGSLVPNATGDLAQIFVQASGTVNIRGIIVDGTGVQFTCLTQDGRVDGGDVPAPNLVIGIEYLYASGSLYRVTARNQSPGGCGVGIALAGSLDVVNTVNVQQSSVINFDDVGIAAFNDYFGVGFVVNVEGSAIASANTATSAGIQFLGPEGLVKKNNVTVAGQNGIYSESWNGDLTTQGNTVTGGAAVGIFSDADLGGENTVIGNSVTGSGVGISGFWTIARSNYIALSSVAAIDTNCSEGAVTDYNTIFTAPIGIVNAIGPVVGNKFYNVTTDTSPCD